MATRPVTPKKIATKKIAAKKAAETTGTLKRTTGKKNAENSPAHSSIVVYIHGIGKHEPKDELKLQWDLALFGVDMKDRSRMAYWSDLLHGTGATVSPLSLRAKRDNSALDVETVLTDAGVSKKSTNAHDYAERLLWSFGGDAPRAAQPNKKVLPLPAFLRKPISKAFLKTFISDTAAYFFKPGMREKIRNRLREQLTFAPGQSVTIVAHSQGSVIAYEVLSLLTESQIELDAFITIGSPLGIREVQDFLEPDSLAIPRVVTRWHNFADPLDPVALDKGLASDFEGGESIIQDEIIVNDKTKRLVGFNPHAAVGYLCHPSVRQAVNEAMRLDPHARFIIARDVAQRLGDDSGQRHPVLIEVLEPGYRALGESNDDFQRAETAELAALREHTDGESDALTLKHRIDKVAADLRAIVSDPTAARIDPLRRFVSARLTAQELRVIGRDHQSMRVYAVWQSSRKRKLTDNRSLSAIKSDAAVKSFAATGESITWAVLDTGIRADHPHFQNTITAVWDCTRPGRPVRIQNDRDRDGHGSHVAGIIAGESPAGNRGVAPKAKLVVYKVLNDRGEGEDAWIIKALDHIAMQNENVSGGHAIHGVNLSLGGYFDPTVYGCGYSPVCAELRRLWRGGVLVVVACGNEGRVSLQSSTGEVELNTTISIGDPANLEDCIAVGSVHAERPHLYGVSSFSSRGPTADGRVKPDVVAPGERILSVNSKFKKQSDWYRFDSGTSMAAPHVSGLLAAFLSVRREFRGRPDEVKKILLQCSIDLGRDRYHQGHGLPNLMQMLLAV
jgi:hypothetical protein